MSTWLLVLPTEGGSRQAALDLRHAFTQSSARDTFQVFDCKKYLDGYTSLLKNNTETLCIDFVNQSLIVTCIEHEITHILIPALCPITVFYLTILKKIHLSTIHYFFEDFRRASYWKDVLPAYDYFFAIQKDSELTDSIQHSCKYLPTATSDVFINAFVETIPQKTIDLCFIGIPSSYRVNLLEYLWHQGHKLCIAGEKWELYQGVLEQCIVQKNWVQPIHASMLYTLSRVSLNCSFHDPDSQRNSTHLSPRIFDICASATMPATEDVPLAHETLRDCSMLYFTTKEELSNKIKELCKSPLDASEFESYKKNHAYIKKNHLWIHRLQSIFDCTTKSSIDHNEKKFK